MTTLTDPQLMAGLWRVSPAAVGSWWSGGRWKRAKHLASLSDALAQIASGLPLRLLVSMPPQHGKSELVSHWLPVWMLANWPQKRIGLASYEAGWAAHWGQQVRDTIAEHGEGLGVRLKGGTAAKDEWETTAGGGMMTAGVGGPFTGRGFDLIIVDDPIKNQEEASSPVIRENIWEWFATTALTRLRPGGSVVVVMTRWDVDDLAGRLLRAKDQHWRSIVYPAFAEENDPLGRELGAPLWPERYDRGWLMAQRREMNNEDFWASLYQQRPNPQGRGLYFDVAASQTLISLCTPPIATQMGGAVSIWQPPVKGVRYVAGGDCAWGEKGAYSVFSVEDYVTGQQVAEVYGRLPLEELADLNVKIAKMYNNAYAGVERNGEGAEVCKRMVELGYGDHMYWHDRDRDMPGWLTEKQNRHVMLARLEERVRTPSIRPGCHDGCGELLSFVRDDKGKPVPRPGTYSDHIMAWAICGEMRDHARWGDLGVERKPAMRPRGW